MLAEMTEDFGVKTLLNNLDRQCCFCSAQDKRDRQGGSDTFSVKLGARVVSCLDPNAGLVSLISAW
jgi:hypothetical protein